MRNTSDRLLNLKMATVKGEGIMISEEARQFLRTRLFGHSFCDYDYKPKFLEDALRTVTQLLQRSVHHGESNSLLVIGPRGVGKSWVIEKALSSFADKGLFIKVYLNGLVHTDDYHALLDIARQLDVHSNFDDTRVSLSFSAALNYMLEGLQSGDKKNKCVIFILDEFDLFTHHKNQALLYNLLDICQSPVNPVALVGLSCRLEVTQLLEKRVRSRFSHRQVLIFPNCHFEEYSKIFLSLLQLPPDNDCWAGTSFCSKWNNHIIDLSKNDSIISILKKLHRHSPDCQNLKSFLSDAVAKLGNDVQFITVPLLIESYHAVTCSYQSKLALGCDLSILELYLLITCKHIISNEQYDFLNYEIIFQEYQKFASKYSHNDQFLNRAIVFKAISRLVELEVLYPISASAASKEYQPLHLMFDESEIMKIIQNYKDCPTELEYLLHNITRVMTANMATFNEKILDDNLPSIFELIAEENMSQALRPAIKYVIKIVFASMPSLSGLSSHVDEMCLIIESLAQGLSFMKFNASISEKFYDLKRYSSDSRGIWKSLAIMLFTPYLLTKLEEWHVVLSEENEFAPFQQNDNLKQSLKYYSYISIPYILTLWRVLKFVFQLLYLCQYSVYYSPELWMSRIQLIRKFEPIISASKPKDSNILKVMMQYVGPVFLFLLKFIEWWYSGDRQGVVRKFTALPNPPPPAPVTLKTDPYTCPLCQKERKNSTALSCSGFVFCYICIYNHIKNHHTCPITSLPAAENQLIRIFVQN